MIMLPRLAPIPQRPRTRGECVDGPRPCPWVSCRYHLLVEVAGGSRLRALGAAPAAGVATLVDQWVADLDELPESCALDCAEDGERTLDEVGVLVGLTRERVRQIAVHALVAVNSTVRGG